MLTVGQRAPDFSVRDHHGHTVSLQGLRGKKVVLWFYPKADTPGCTAEACSFRDLAAEYDRKNAVILGVSFDTEAENRAFASKYGLQFPLLCDTTRELGLKYGACDDAKASNARRIGIVINEDGKVQAYYPKVDAKTFPAEVIQTL